MSTQRCDRAGSARSSSEPLSTGSAPEALTGPNWAWKRTTPGPARSMSDSATSPSAANPKPGTSMHRTDHDCLGIGQWVLAAAAVTIRRNAPDVSPGRPAAPPPHRRVAPFRAVPHQSPRWPAQPGLPPGEPARRAELCEFITAAQRPCPSAQPSTHRDGVLQARRGLALAPPARRPGHPR